MNPENGGQMVAIYIFLAHDLPTILGVHLEPPILLSVKAIHQAILRVTNMSPQKHSCKPKIISRSRKQQQQQRTQQAESHVP